MSLNILKSYSKLSTSSKVLFFICIIYILISVLKQYSKKSFEGFSQQIQISKDFTHLEGDTIYDEFYSNVYDTLFYNDAKNVYEIHAINDKIKFPKTAKILDVGCGTGHHIKLLHSLGYDNTIGIDKSNAMVETARKNFPDGNFLKGDIMNAMQFQHNSFDTILCLYFTIYYIKNKERFFRNCYDFLNYGGVLCIHLVDKHNFDPILTPSNPLTMISPQRYAKQRITKSKVFFNGYDYMADFKLDGDNALFIEKFTDKKSKKVRKQEHYMFMETSEDILQVAQSIGFIVEAKIDLLPVQFEYNYIYVLRKSN